MCGMSGEKLSLVEVCPRCGSIAIMARKNRICRECNYQASSFPQLVVNDLHAFREQLERKGKRKSGSKTSKKYSRKQIVRWVFIALLFGLLLFLLWPLLAELF